MIGSTFGNLRQFARRLWVRAALVSLMAIVAALLAPLSDLLPFSLKTQIDETKLQSLLDILTNSMLTVTTFSLSIMVTAHLAADTSATPRAHRLLQQDSRTQTVLATFIGAFVYALTLTIMLSTGVFAEGEMAVIYFFTVGVIAFVVLAILRWVGHLDGLGSVEATLRRSEERAREAITLRADEPFLGGRPIDTATIPADTHALRADRAGYVQKIEMEKVSQKLAEWEGTLYLRATPGNWVVPGDTLADVAVEAWPEERASALRHHFTIDDRREHGQDTSFSLVVLAEIGERALSPGINDPRTGIDVIGRLTRLILSLPPERAPDEPRAPNVYAPGLDPADVLRSCLDAVVRDGRTFHEVVMATQRAAAAIARHPDPGFGEAARVLSARILAYARDGLLLVDDRERIRAAGPADEAAAITPQEDVAPADPEGDEPTSEGMTAGKARGAP